ncbi:MAG: PhaM family polyhydroxyalkanoate granule multifunctional regulatory protein [Rubrivivax sp.]
MATATDFAKMVPGFDFLQGLMKGAGNSLPNIGQWIAPTLDPAELEKRIQELKTVQFWLEQNARMLGATIQALEVQRMTLATLKTMNMPVAEVRKAFELKTPAPVAAAPAPAAEPPPAPRKPRPKPAAKAAAATPPSAAGGSVDPMQWWGALTRQFGELAANAIKDSGAAAALPSASSAPAAPKKTAAAARKRAR